MRIIVETVDHDEQRYDTCGDWEYDAQGTLHVRVSRLPDRRHMLLTALHEIIEAELCRQRGIKEEDVSAFDIAFEKARLGPSIEGDFLFQGIPHTANDEPGDSPVSPYRHEHCFAEGFTRMLASALGVNYYDYEQASLSLGG